MTTSNPIASVIVINETRAVPLLGTNNINRLYAGHQLEVLAKYIVRPNHVSHPLTRVQTRPSHSFLKDVVNTVRIIREEKLRIKRGWYDLKL